MRLKTLYWCACISIIVFLYTNVLFATDFPTIIYTPNGTAVYALLREEMSQEEIQNTNNAAMDDYPSAELISDASKQYNCHTYAWYVSEGGDTVWINSPGQESFWTDKSYIAIGTEVDGAKVSYASADHSAVTTTTSGEFISKWGEWPLMKHGIGSGESPYDASNVKYYIRNDDPAASVSGFSVIGKVAQWRVSSEYKTVKYWIEGSHSFDNDKWVKVVEEPSGAGFHSVQLSGSDFPIYRLVELEDNGKRIYHAFSKSGSRHEIPKREHATVGQLTKRLSSLKEEASRLGKEYPEISKAAAGEKYVIFTVDSLKSIVESYVADYWEGMGYTVYLRTVDNYPSDPDSFRAALKDSIAEYASNGAMYFQLIGDANDWQQFRQEWPGSWEQIRQGYLACGFPEDGQPEKDLIPTWAFSDTLSRDHSTPWFVPYYLTDKPYSDTDDDGVPDVVLTRWPVTQQWEVLALALKMQEYMQGYELISSSYPSNIINCVGNLDHDGESDGALASAFVDTVTAEIPPEHYQSWIYESDYYYDCDRNIEAAARWNSVAPNLVFILSSYSKRVWPGNFFDQTNVITPFHMGMIYDDTPFATVLAMSCDAADFARTEDPEYGLPIFHRFLVEEDKGAIAWIGPMLGSWQDGNKVIAKYFVQEIYSDLSRPVAESYLAAMQRVYTDFAGCKSILQTADLYTFLGHPLLTLRRRPIITATGREEMPVASSLAQNYPNPFNPVTTIRFSSSRKGRVELLIYDVKGRKVNVLVDREMTAGRHSVSWNGKNDSGRSVASGLYFYRLKTRDKVITRKMVLLK